MRRTRYLPWLALFVAIRATDGQVHLRDTGWRPRLGVHLGTPAIVSLAGGIAMVARADGVEWREYFLTVEPGVNAGRVAVGLGDWHRDSAHWPRTGYVARAALLRRWHRASVNYAGVELSLPLAGPRVGVFRPISGNTNEAVRFTADAFFGW